MSVVTLQVGQCGNQVGSALFSTMWDTLASGSGKDDAGLSTFFREEGRAQGPTHCARAVLMDMEAKVVSATLRSPATLQLRGEQASPGPRSLAWQYNSKGSFHQQSGCGNNWAAGFHTYAPQFRDHLMDLIQTEAEKCDHLGGFLLLQSLAGGTGAGLGAAVAEMLRDEFPSTFLLSHSIWWVIVCLALSSWFCVLPWLHHSAHRGQGGSGCPLLPLTRPYASGEVIVQSYNTVLSLSHAMEHSDGLILVENEVLHRTCQSLLGIKSPSFQDLNAVAARAISAALLPAQLVQTDSGSASVMNRGYGRVRLLGDLVEHLSCHPAYPVLTSHTVPQIPDRSMSFETFTWPSILKRLRQMLLTGSKLEEGMNWNVKLGASERSAINKSLANYLVLRGEGAVSADTFDFADPRLYSPLSSQPLMVAASTQKLRGCDMTACLLSNSQACLAPVCHTLEKAYQMYSSKAFTHQYVQHGLSLQDFDTALSRTEDLVARYQLL